MHSSYTGCKASPLSLFAPYRNAAVLTLLAAITFLLLGYHPGAEDAGMYLSGIHLALAPALYPVSRPFILAYMHLTAFPWFFATAVHLLHLPLAWALLCAQFALLWLLLYALRSLARLCFASPAAQWTSVALTAFCLSTPVAGTALSLADSYLTPRSFATPFTLLLLAAVLARRPRLAAVAVLVLICFHPLMAVYACAIALVLWMRHNHRHRIALLLGLAAVLTAGIVTLTQQRAIESPAYIAAALTRTYFYLSQWQWYELIGLIAPLAIFLALFRANRARPEAHHSNRASLSATALTCGITAILICALFAHPGSHSHLIARLQPLRIFHTLYLVLFLLLAGTVAEHLTRRVSGLLMLALLLSAAAATMFFVECQTFPASGHLEMPWLTPRNPWQQAFLWIRDNTPTDAVFALDANYITTDGEDGQNFRATAERSSLSDYSKDGGTSAIFPSLAPAWQQGQQLSANLSTLSDAARRARLVPAGVTWVILQRHLQHGTAQTRFNCPYRNPTVIACRLP